MQLFTPVVFAESSKAAPPVKARKIRPSQLPIYDEPEDVFNFEYQCDERGMIEDGVGVVRQEIEGAYKMTETFREQTANIYQTGVAHTAASVDVIQDFANQSGTLDYIREEENILPKAGVITVGGLTGLLFATLRKGGLIKKLLYSSAGLAGSASVCYPQEATEASKSLVNYAEIYGTVAYNFVAGVKPQSKSTNGEEITEAKPDVESPVKPASEPDKSDVPSNESTESAVEVTPPVEEVTEKPTTIEGDIGQSNPEDSDMYTTRN